MHPGPDPNASGGKDATGRGEGAGGPADAREHGKGADGGAQGTCTLSNGLQCLNHQ